MKFGNYEEFSKKLILKTIVFFKLCYNCKSAEIKKNVYFVTRQTTGTCYDIFNCKYMFNIKSSAIPSSSFWWRFGNDPEFAFFERNVLAKKLPRLFLGFFKEFSRNFQKKIHGILEHKFKETQKGNF